MDVISFGNRGSGREQILCGRGRATIVIAGVGASDAADSLAVERDKVVAASEAGADMIADHSFFGDIDRFHRELVTDLGARLSIVASYELAVRHRSESRGWALLKSDDVLSLVQEQIDRGVDVLTVHASLARSDLGLLRRTKRIVPMTSKGGGIIAEYMESTGAENPYLESYEGLVRLLSGTGVAISLGTTFRPGSVCDEWDELNSVEVNRMGELIRLADAAGVPAMVEGLGHVSLDRIPEVVRRTKEACAAAPYRILAVPTDRGLGADHISGAIAAAVAVSHGANLVMSITRQEHVGLPNRDDVVEAVTATRIAAGIGELALTKDYSAEQSMSEARWSRGCQGDLRRAISAYAAARAVPMEASGEDGAVGCGMCGEYCGLGFAKSMS